MTLSMDETVSTKTVLKWKAENVAEWLKAIGLEKYSSKFKRNMITGAILVQLDELLLDDLDISNINDREILLQSVAAFEDCTKTGSLNQSSLVTSFAHDDDHKNTKCQPEMEVLKTDENVEEKTTKFPAFAELLPTIGEEDEINDGEEKVSDKSLTTISSSSNDDVIHTQLKKLEKTDIDMVDTMKENGLKTERNVNLSKDVASSSSGHVSSRLGDDEVASRATQIVQVFSEENMCLRKQLEKYYQQIKQLKSVDKELRDTQIMYKDLKSAFITREHKEKAMRSRMEAEIAQLQANNAELTDELKELQAVFVNKRPEKELKELEDEISQKDSEVKQLQKERKSSKSSLQNLERILKQKSSEIIILRQQLEKSVCNVCRSKQMREGQNNEHCEKKTSGDFLEQFRESMMKSSYGRSGAKFHRSYQKFRNEQNDLDINTCVPVLVELLKEKDAEIIKLRNEIDQEMSRVPEKTGNKWSPSIIGSERLPKYRHSKQRYSDLETEIKSLHVKLAEKDAQIKILQCKYGESSVDSSNALSTPFRVPSFTSQSSVSSYQDSGIMTSSDGHFDEGTYQNTKDLQNNPERYSPCLQESEYYDDEHELNKQEKDGPVLNDHCWFV